MEAPKPIESTDFQEFIPDVPQSEPIHIQRIAAQLSCFNSMYIQPGFIQQELVRGIPDEAYTRGFMWQYATSCLSPFRHNRQFHQIKDRNTYRQYIFDFLETPLSASGEQLTKNIKIMQQKSIQIVKDLHRTQTHMNFYKLVDNNESLLNDTFNGLIPKPLKSPHLSALFRILFVYSTLNIEGYTQGQNEIVSQLYMTHFKNSKESQIFVEADTFWMFQNLMSYMRGLYNCEDDDSNIGLTAATERLENWVQQMKPKLSKRMKQCNISTKHFSISWITTLFVQQVTGPDLERLWDSIMGNCFLNKQQILLKFGASQQQVQEQLQEKIIQFDFDFRNYKKIMWIDFIFAISLVIMEYSAEKENFLEELQSLTIFQNVEVLEILKKAEQYYKQMNKVMK